MNGNKSIFIFLFLCLIATSYSVNNWTIFNNSITINSYTTKLTTEERDNYYYWIGLRNSFYYSDDSDQLEKLVKYFTPEEDDYYKDLFAFSAPGFICAGVVFVIFLVYCVKRFLLKGCKGPKIIVKSYHHTTYFFIISGFLVGLIFLSLTIYNSGKSNSNIDTMMNYVQDQKDLLNGIYEETFKNLKNLKELLKDEPNVNVTMYGENIIVETNKELSEKYDNFYDDLYRIQKHKFRFQVSSLVLFLIISIAGVAGYWVRREYIPWIASIILLLLASPVFAMAGLETTYTFLSIDFCSSIGNSIISGITPSENEGIGTYLSCPSKDAMRSISTAIYQYIVGFDYLYNQVDEIFNEEENIALKMFSDYSLGKDKRNNTYFKELYNKIKDMEISDTGNEELDKEKQRRKTVVLRNLQSFGIMNVLLAGLLSMTSCYTAKNSINYIEEKYCYENHGYMFRNVIFDTIAALGFVIISVGLNKLVITMRSHFARALRGKKEFNTDIINDDDDD